MQVLVICLFPTPHIKLKLGLQVGGRLLLIATHLDLSNYLANQKQGAVNKYDLTVFIRMFQGSSRALKSVISCRVPVVFQWIHWIGLMNLIQDFHLQGSKICHFLQGSSSLPVDPLDWTDEPHPRFLVQGHILSIGGDALTKVPWSTSVTYPVDPPSFMSHYPGNYNLCR